MSLIEIFYDVGLIVIFRVIEKLNQPGYLFQTINPQDRRNNPNNIRPSKDSKYVYSSSYVKL